MFSEWSTYNKYRLKRNVFRFFSWLISLNLINILHKNLKAENDFTIIKNWFHHKVLTLSIEKTYYCLLVVRLPCSNQLTVKTITGAVHILDGKKLEHLRVVMGYSFVFRYKKYCRIIRFSPVVNFFFSFIIYSFNCHCIFHNISFRFKYKYSRNFKHFSLNIFFVIK